eukprot:TRINITY_DN331_c0_g1_i4.p1 TRINITY_DN331_c0_g1~~TRINITY_DN331_c0_g1_i4.p1  ORF type:complete len:195 (+),score=67.21 TRINITY_DN331_c0_g1_i4:114-698(+)
MFNFNPVTGQIANVVGKICDPKYTLKRPSAFDRTTGNYFNTAYDAATQLYYIITYNINTLQTTITPPVGGTDPIRLEYPVELTWVPSKSRLYALTNSMYGGGMESIDWQTGNWFDVVAPGHFSAPYDVENVGENKNGEACFDEQENWWYLEMWDYSDPSLPEGVVLPWDVATGKWASGAWSMSDDISNWAFVWE